MVKLRNEGVSERLGKLMKRDPDQLTDGLSGRRKPCKRNLDNITAFLSRSLP
jgi:hypothetical protein